MEQRTEVDNNRGYFYLQSEGRTPGHNRRVTDVLFELEAVDQTFLPLFEETVRGKEVRGSEEGTREVGTT